MTPRRLVEPLFGLLVQEPFAVDPDNRKSDHGSGKMRKSAIGAAMTCMFVLSLPSFAAGPPNNTNTATRAMSGSVQQTPNTGGVAREDGGATPGQGSVDAAIAGIRSSAESAKRVQSMSKVAFVQIVDIGSGGEEERVAIDKAVSENRDGINGLRDAIRANAPLSARLDEKSVKPESVMATKLNDDGSLTVFIDKSSAQH
jgi:hypothetical protein